MRDGGGAARALAVLLGVACMVSAATAGPTSLVAGAVGDGAINCGDLDGPSCNLWKHLCGLMPAGECAQRSAPCSDQPGAHAGADWNVLSESGNSPCGEENVGGKYPWWAGTFAKVGVCCVKFTMTGPQTLEMILLPAAVSVLRMGSGHVPHSGAQGVLLSGALDWSLFAAVEKLKAIDFAEQVELTGSLPATRAEYAPLLEALRITGVGGPIFKRAALKGTLPKWMFETRWARALDFSYTSISGEAPDSVDPTLAQCAGFPSALDPAAAHSGGGEATCCNLRGTLIDCVSEDTLAFCRIGEVLPSEEGGVVPTNSTPRKCENSTSTAPWHMGCLATLEEDCGRQKAFDGPRECERCLRKLNPGPEACISTTGGDIDLAWCKGQQAAELSSARGPPPGPPGPPGPDLCEPEGRVYDYYWWCASAIAPTRAPTPAAGGPTLPPAAHAPGVLPWNPAGTPASVMAIVAVMGALALMGFVISAVLAVRRMQSRRPAGWRGDAIARGVPLLNYADDSSMLLGDDSSEFSASTAGGGGRGTRAVFAAQLGDLLIPSSQIEVGRKIAAGGMGEVRLGRLGGETVVLKATFDQLLHGEEDTFWHEAKMLERIRHPRVVDFYGVTQVPMRTQLGGGRHVDEGRTRFFLVMEYLERGSIVDNVRRGQYCLQTSFMEHATQLASTIAWLHLRGIVHRDIKPGNVLLDATGGIKLCDLGVSRYLPGNAAELFGQAESAAGAHAGGFADATMTINIGTVKYMPPELLSFGFGGEAHPDLAFAATPTMQADSGIAGGNAASARDIQGRAPIDSIDNMTMTDVETGVGVASQDLRDLMASHASGTYPPSTPKTPGFARYDGRAWDVYAMGMVLIFMWKQRPLFRGMSAWATASAVVRGLRPEIPSSMPRELADLIQSMWTGKPADRPSASEVSDALQAPEMIAAVADALNGPAGDSSNTSSSSSMTSVASPLSSA